MPVTADEVLELRKKYKRAKNQYKAVVRADKVEEPAAPVLAPKQRKARDRNRPRTDKEKANDERLKAQTALAKEIRAKDPNLKWIDAIRQASQQMKAQ